jgi:hypothetical protein
MFTRVQYYDTMLSNKVYYRYATEPETNKTSYAWKNSLGLSGVGVRRGIRPTHMHVNVFGISKCSATGRGYIILINVRKL